MYICKYASHIDVAYRITTSHSQHIVPFHPHTPNSLTHCTISICTYVCAYSINTVHSNILLFALKYTLLPHIFYPIYLYLYVYIYLHMYMHIYI